MAFNGKLVELKTNGSWVNLPLTYIKSESYKVTPNQRMEASASRSADGVLVRTTVSHTASKIEFNTINLTNSELKTLYGYFSAAFTNATERKLELRYYNPETDTYKTGDFYKPDADYDINRVDISAHIVHYNPIRFAIIEY